jgi:hypothetical protein
MGSVSHSNAEIPEESRPTYQMSGTRWPFDEERHIIYCLTNILNTRIAVVQVVVNNDCEIQLWHPSTWKKLWSMSGQFETNTPCDLISFSETGKYLLINERFRGLSMRNHVRLIKQFPSISTILRRPWRSLSMSLE